MMGASHTPCSVLQYNITVCTCFREVILSRVDSYSLASATILRMVSRLALAPTSQVAFASLRVPTTARNSVFSWHTAATCMREGHCVLHGLQLTVKDALDVNAPA